MNRRLTVVFAGMTVPCVALAVIAQQEKTQKTAERLQGLIDRRQAECHQILQKIGAEP